MGMTIDDAILDLTELKICGVVPFTKGTISGGNYKVVTDECINVAIETMRKHKKIQEIVQSKTTRVSYDIGFRQIKKVVEDGDDKQ